MLKVSDIKFLFEKLFSSNHVLLRNSSWLLIQKGVNFTFGFFIGLFVLRYLGPARYGELSYAISITGILSFLAVLGLDSIVVRELIKYPDKKNIILGTTFVLKLIGSLSLIITAVAGEFILSGEGRSIKFVFIIAIGYVFDAFRVVDFHFQAQKELKYPAIARVFGDIIFSLGRIYFVLTNAEIEKFVWLQGFYMAFYGLFFYLINQKHGIPIRLWRYSVKEAKTLLTHSMPLIFSSIMVLLYARIDQVMLKKLVGSEMVGTYAAILKLVEMFYLVPTIITTSVFPTLVDLRETNYQHYLKRLQNLHSLFFIILFFVSVVVTIFAGIIVDICYGEAYSDGTIVLQIMIWNSIFLGFFSASGCWYIAENLQRLAFWRNSLGGIANIILNLLLIPTLGAVGSAIASLSSRFLSSFVFEAFTPTTRVIFYMKIRALWLPYSIKKATEMILRVKNRTEFNH